MYVYSVPTTLATFIITITLTSDLNNSCCECVRVRSWRQPTSAIFWVLFEHFRADVILEFGQLCMVRVRVRVIALGFHLGLRLDCREWKPYIYDSGCRYCIYTTLSSMHWCFNKQRFYRCINKRVFLIFSYFLSERVLQLRTACTAICIFHCEVNLDSTGLMQHIESVQYSVVKHWFPCTRCLLSQCSRHFHLARR